MALISCPECAKQISDKANSCPSCGYPVQEAIASIAQPNQAKEGAKSVHAHDSNFQYSAQAIDANSTLERVNIGWEKDQHDFTAEQKVEPPPQSNVECQGEPNEQFVFASLFDINTYFTLAFLVLLLALPVIAFFTHDWVVALLVLIFHAALIPILLVKDIILASNKKSWFRSIWFESDDVMEHWDTLRDEINANAHHVTTPIFESIVSFNPKMVAGFSARPSYAQPMYLAIGILTATTGVFFGYGVLIFSGIVLGLSGALAGVQRLEVHLAPEATKYRANLQQRIFWAPRGVARKLLAVSSQNPPARGTRSRPATGFLGKTIVEHMLSTAAIAYLAWYVGDKLLPEFGKFSFKHMHDQYFLLMGITAVLITVQIVGFYLYRKLKIAAGTWLLGAIGLGGFIAWSFTDRLIRMDSLIWFSVTAGLLVIAAYFAYQSAKEL